MKEVFRSSDAGRVGLYQSILADAGIGPFVRHSSIGQTRACGLTAQRPKNPAVILNGAFGGFATKAE